MGHPEDLDDYESELELALKREYQTVYPLFTFCVITQEATYLCNQLAVRAVPGVGTVMFDLQMDDVWVWDRNRPTRIIPSARIFTSGDLSIEQLKEVDEGERLIDIVPASLLDDVADDDEVPEVVSESDAKSDADSSDQDA